MVLHKNCPRCQQEISERRLQQTPAICDNCGFVVSVAETRVRENMEKSVLRSAIIVSVIVLAAFMHLGSWGSYSLEIIPLKIGQLSRTSSAVDMERLVEIGMDLKKYELVEQEYVQLAEHVDPKNYIRLGKFQLQRLEFKEAAETYRQFFALGKRDLEARFDYARALGEIGQIDESSKNFEYVLGSRPGIRQVTVLQKYVNMLVKAQRFDQAQKVIEHVRHQDPAASRFMDTEYKVIEERKKSRS